MTIESTQGSLTIVGSNTDSVKYYWKGQELINVIGMSVLIKKGTTKYNRISVTNVNDPVLDAIYTEMEQQGINVRKVGG